MSALEVIKQYYQNQIEFFKAVKAELGSVVSQSSKPDGRVSLMLIAIVGCQDKMSDSSCVPNQFLDWFAAYSKEAISEHHRFSVEAVQSQVRREIKSREAVMAYIDRISGASDNNDAKLLAKVCDDIINEKILDVDFIAWFVDQLPGQLEQYFGSSLIERGKFSEAIIQLKNTTLNVHQRLAGLSIIIEAYDIFHCDHERRETYHLGSQEYMVKLNLLDYDPKRNYEDKDYATDKERAHARISVHDDQGITTSNIGRLAAMKEALLAQFSNFKVFPESGFSAEEIFNWVCALSGQSRIGNGLYSTHAVSKIFASQFMDSVGARLTPMVVVHLNKDDLSELKIEFRYAFESCRFLGADEPIRLSAEDLGVVEYDYDVKGVDEAAENIVGYLSQFITVLKVEGGSYRLGMRFECVDSTVQRSFYTRLKKAGLSDHDSVAQAAFRGDIDALRSLVLKGGCDVNEPVGAGHLSPASMPSRTDFIRYQKGRFGLFEKAYVDSDRFDQSYALFIRDKHQDVDGLTPLHLAVIGNHLEAVKVCVTLGAHIHNFNDGTFHQSAYDLAVKMYGVKSGMAQFLLKELLKQRAYLRAGDGVKSDFGAGVSYEMQHHVVQGTLANQPYVMHKDALIFESVGAIESSDEFPYQSMMVRIAKALASSDKNMTEVLGAFGIRIESTNSTVECDVLGDGVVSVKYHVMICSFSLATMRASLMPGVDYVANDEGPLAVYTEEKVVRFDASNNIIAANTKTTLLDLTRVGFFDAMKTIGLLAPTEAGTAKHAVSRSSSGSSLVLGKTPKPVGDNPYSLMPGLPAGCDEATDPTVGSGPVSITV